MGKGQERRKERGLCRTGRGLNAENTGNGRRTQQGPPLGQPAVPCRKPHAAADRSGRHQGSQARSDGRPRYTEVERGSGDGTGRPKAGLMGRVGEERELSQGVEAEGLVRWSQVWLPTAAHPRWKHSIQSHDPLPRNETIMTTGGNSRF